MISLNEAYNKCIEAAYFLGDEKVNLNQSRNRILAEDVYSDMNMPPFDKSAVDGFACRSIDLKNDLEIVEIIQAGAKPLKEIRENQCAKIMTGAAIPKGADTVIMVEDVENISDNRIKYKVEKVKGNICFLGEDIKKGTKILDKNVLIKPAHVAVLASMGKSEVLVSKQPKIGIIPTGNEIVEPNEIPNKFKIRNSNGHQLIAQLEEINAIANYKGIASDNQNHLKQMIINAIDENDIILLTGGVSMGDYDLVPDILQELGFEIVFHKINVQPGRPTLFAKKENKFCYGLPGNPVSSFVQFELLVKPLIFKLMGHDYKPKNIKLSCATDYKRKRAKRMSLIPVLINKNSEVEPISYHGSAHINALTYADGLCLLNVGQFEINKGDIVNVRLI